MNLLDIGVLVLVSLVALRCCVSGFFSSATIYLGWWVSAILFSKRFKEIEALVMQCDGDVSELNSSLVSYAISASLAITSLWFFYFVSQRIGKLTEQSGFTEGDRVLGLVLGVFSGWYIAASIIYIINIIYPLSLMRVWQESLLAPLLSDAQVEIWNVISFLIERWRLYNL